MTSCQLCKRDCVVSSTLCKYHLTAKKNVESAYPQWKVAYADISWRHYLEAVERNSATGRWAKEVAALLAKETPE
jgi:hypothetical protein